MSGCFEHIDLVSRRSGPDDKDCLHYTDERKRRGDQNACPFSNDVFRPATDKTWMLEAVFHDNQSHNLA